MDFSAFLESPMRKHKKTPELRQVEELPKEDLELLPETEQKKTRLEVKDRSELKFRSHEPVLVEMDQVEDISPEDDWDTESPQRRDLGWWIALGVAVLVCTIWLTIELNKSGPVAAAVGQKVGTAETKEERDEREAKETIASIYRVVNLFYAADTPDEMIQQVRHPERVRPLMETHYSRKPLRASAVSLVEGMNPLTIGTRSDFWVVQTRHESGDQGKAVVEVLGPHHVKVDWETHVCYQPMEWDDFVKNRPANYRGDFRVYVERDDFYNYEFQDNQIYQSYKLSTLNSHEILYGYVKRDSPAYRLIEESLLQNDGRPAPMMLRLHLPEGLESKSGVSIEKIMTPRWLVIDEKEVAE